MTNRSATGDSAGTGPKAAREQRLADALRANLKRRKARERQHAAASAAQAGERNERSKEPD